MNTKKILGVLKSGAAYFTSSAGGVAFVIGMVALFVTVGWVAVPIILTIGVAAGIYGAYQKYKKMEAADQEALLAKLNAEEEKNERTRIQGIEKEQLKISDVTRHIDDKVIEMVALEHKFEEKYQKHEPLQIHVHMEEKTAIEALPLLFSHGHVVTHPNASSAKGVSASNNRRHSV